MKKFLSIILTMAIFFYAIGLQSICFADSALGCPCNNSNEYSTSKQKSEPQGKFWNIVTTLAAIVTTTISYLNSKQLKNAQEEFQEKFARLEKDHQEALRSLRLTKTEWEVNEEKLKTCQRDLSEKDDALKFFKEKLPYWKTNEIELNTAKADLANCQKDLSKTDFTLGILGRNLSQEKAVWLYNRALKILHFNWIGNKLTEKQWEKAINEIDLCEQNLICKYTGWGCKPCEDNYYGNVYGLLFPNNNGK